MANEIQTITKLYCANAIGYLGSEQQSRTLNQTVGRTDLGSGTQSLTTTDALLNISTALAADIANGIWLEIVNTDASIDVLVNLTSGAGTPAFYVPAGTSVLVMTKTQYYVKSASGTPVIHWKACEK